MSQKKLTQGQNIKKETEYMEGFLNSMENNLNPPNLETLTKISSNLIDIHNQNEMHTFFNSL